MPLNGSETELIYGAAASGSGRRKEQQGSPGDLTMHDQHSSHSTQGTCALPENLLFKIAALIGCSH